MAFKGKAKESPETTELEPWQQELHAQHERNVAIRTTRASDDDLSAIASFEDAVRLAQQQHGDVKSIDEFELGTGFRVLEDKTVLVGKPFIIVQFTFNEGDYADEFASMHIVTNDGAKLIVNDGGTGLCQDLKDLAQKERFGGVLVPNGLRISEYDTCSACEQPRKKKTNPCVALLSNGTECGDTSDERHAGKTFYLDLSG